MSTPTTTITWTIDTLEGDASDGFADRAHFIVVAVSSETDSNGVAYSDGVSHWMSPWNVLRLSCLSTTYQKLT